MTKHTKPIAQQESDAGALAFEAQCSEKNGPRENLDAAFAVTEALEARGLTISSLSTGELNELQDLIRELLTPLFDRLVDQWQEEHAELSEQEQVDRELRRRITADRDDHLDDRFECEGCNFRHWEHAAFVEFHGLLLCDGCHFHARDELRDIQQPLIERLAAEPTLENARALGFELTRHDGRLVWISDDDEYEGGEADEQEALAYLLDEFR